MHVLCSQMPIQLLHLAWDEACNRLSILRTLFILFDFGCHQTSNQLSCLFIFVLQQTWFPHRLKREAGGGWWAGPCCIVWLTVMTNKLVMKAKLSSCCQNFTLNETQLDISLCVMLCANNSLQLSNIAEQHSVCAAVQCLHVNFSPALNNSLCRVNFCLKIFAMLVVAL